MSVIDKIDEYVTRKDTKKKIIKESTDINADILDLLNSLDDSMLDETQIELKERILSANFEAQEDDVDDVVVDLDDYVDDVDIDVDLDTIIDDDIPPSDDSPIEDSLTGVEMEDEYFNPYKMEEGKKQSKPSKKKNNNLPEKVGKSKKKK